MARQRNSYIADRGIRPRTVILVAIAAAIVLAGAAGAIWGAVVTHAPDTGSATVASSSSREPTSGTTRSTATGNDVDGAVDRGLLQEPVTSDPSAYGTAAAAALWTYDTAQVSRDQLLAHLSSWHTAPWQIASDKDRQASLEGKLRELALIIPSIDEWKDQATLKTIVSAAAAASKTDYEHISSFEAGSLDDLIDLGYHIVTTELTVSYSEIDAGTGQRYTYEALTSVTVQVQCGHSLVEDKPAQRPSDCAVVRYFDDALV